MLKSIRNHHKQFFVIVTAISVLTSLIFFGGQAPTPAEAASYTFTQTDWSGGLSTTSTATHPTNQTGWTNYSSSTSINTTPTTGQLTLSSSWWNSSWQNRRKITFSGATTTSNLSNFPILVSLNSSRIDYSKTKSGGADIRFVDPNDTTSLNYEIEKWDSSATSTIWVKANHVSSTQTDYIWMYYNNTSATDNSTTTGVWDSNFQSVWHLKETAITTGAYIIDSTSNANNGSSTGTSYPTPTSTGKIDGAQDFDGNDLINITGTKVYATTTSSFAVSAWYFLDSSVLANAPDIIVLRTNTNSGLHFLFLDNPSFLGFSMGSAESWATIKTDDDPTTLTNAWHHISVTYNGQDPLTNSNFQVIIDGRIHPITSAGGYGSSGVQGTTIGGAANSVNYFKGRIDELRVSNAVRSSAWIEAEYKNGVDIYNTYGSEESSIGSGNLISSAYDSGNTANIISQLSWDEDASLPASTTVTVSLKTASSSAGLSSASFTDFTATSTGCSKSSGAVTCGSSSIPSGMKDGVNDEWFQYKVTLTSWGANTPTLSEVRIQYSANSPPDFNPNYPTVGAGGSSANQDATSTDANWGKVNISYAVRDVDTNSGSSTPGYITPSFEYNVGGGWIAIGSQYLAAGDTSNQAVSTSTYATHTATWDVKSQVANTYSTSSQIRVTANDNEAVNNTSSTTSAAFTLDTKNPAATTTMNIASGTVSVALSDNSNIEYRLSNNSDFSADGQNSISGSWQSVGSNSTSTSLSWSFSSSTYPKAYVNTRDIYANTVTSTLVTPATPTNVAIRDVSNVASSQFSLFLSWDVYTATSSASFSSYRVYRSTDGSSYSLFNTITDVNTNFYQNTGLSSSTLYYYKLTINDTDGDQSNFSSVVSATPNGQGGGTDVTAPIITNLQTSTTQATWATITWTTDELSNSEVNYGTSAGSFGSTASSTSYVTSHSVTLSSLTPSTTYYYRVKSRDIFGNTATSDNGGSGFSFTTIGGPTISDVTTKEVTDNGATIVWNTNTAANSYVVYSTNSNLSGSSETGSASLVTGPPYQHSVALTSLSSRTTYYYYVKSTDVNSNTVTDTNGGNYYSFKTTYDTKAPVISNVSTPVVTKTSAIVTWQTDENATAQVEYGGSSGSYANTTTLDSTLSVYHNQTISNLDRNTKYYYRVHSKDANGNKAVSSESNFTTSDVDQIIVSTAGGAAPPPVKDTTPPVISSIEVLNLGAFGATISFTTNESSVAFVSYGKDPTYGNTAGSSDFKTRQEVKLSGLRMGTEYHFKVKAQDKDGNSATSNDQTFNTKYISEALEETVTLENASEFQDKLENLIESVLPSIVPPFIGKIEVTDIAENAASISFTSNVPSYGALAYAPEKDYGVQRNDPYSVELAIGDKKEREHKVNLLNLSPSTIYHFQAKAFVFPGAVGKFKDQTFITKASRIKTEVIRVGNTDMDVRWATPTKTSSFVEYRNLTTGKLGRSGDETKIQSHAVSLQNLDPDTPYEVKAFGYDQNNNIVEGDPVTVKTKRDIVPPQISNIRIDNALLPGRADRLQSVISWRTDESANSVVYFEEGVGISETLSNKTGNEKEYTTDHIVIIANFKPSTVYRIQILSADESNNITKSSIRSILTPRSAESVLDVITRNLQETFGFLKKLQR